MKGQISFLEFLVTFLVFITFVSYIFFQLINARPTYLQEAKNEIVRAEAYQISEMLINDPGEPRSWTAANVKRIGLSYENVNKTNLLSVTKISNFDTVCNNYDTVKKLLGSEQQFRIIVFDLSSTPKFLPVVCEPTVTVAKPTISQVKRVVAFTDGVSNSYGELIVQVW